MDSLTAPDTPQAHAQLLDALVEELWREGMLADRAGTAEPGPTPEQAGGQ
jgi:hypothetical protein